MTRLSAKEIESALSKYPDQLSGFDWDSLDVITVANSNPQRWSVYVRFKSSSSDSDLTLSLFMQDDAPESGVYRMDISDIHVL